MLNLMLQYGGDANAPDLHQKTPIYYAVDAGCLESVNILLQHGQTAKASCNDLRTPLHDASERGNIDIATALLDHEADVNAQNWNKVMPLHLAAKYGRFDMLELLLEHGAAIDAQDDQGQTPLHHASMNGNGEICRFLITSGCDHMLTDNNGQKATEVANTKELSKELTDFIIQHLITKSRGIERSSSNMGICVFCQNAQADFVFLPCHDVSLCEKCYAENKDSLKFCPMCRKTLQSVEKINKE